MPDSPLTPTAGVDAALASALAVGAAAVVLVDGPSGSGKSVFADRLMLRWPTTGPRPQLVRMDWLYPGWHGLDAAVDEVVAGILERRRAGAPGRWRRWDWLLGEPGAEHVVEPDRPLVLEGCGTLSRGARGLFDVGVWIEADDRVRKARALARDAGAFDGHWDEWDRQWKTYVARDEPEARASVRVDGGR